MANSSSHPRDVSILARRHRRHRSTHPWVQVTLFSIVAALLVGVMALPSPVPPNALNEDPAYDLRVALGELRSAIAEYEHDHGAWPGYPPGSAVQDCPPPSAEWLERQLTRTTEPSGELNLGIDPLSCFGPYLHDSLPVNPVNGLASVRVLAAHELWPHRADDSTGWIYRPENGEIRANAAGSVLGSHVRYDEL